MKMTCNSIMTVKIQSFATEGKLDAAETSLVIRIPENEKPDPEPRLPKKRGSPLHHNKSLTLSPSDFIPQSFMLKFFSNMPMNLTMSLRSN